MPHFRRLSSVAGLLILSGAGLCTAQTSPDQPAYLELSWQHVKQDKVAEYGQLSTRVADANRHGKGDHWVAYADYYGRDNTIWFGAARASLSDVQTGAKNFLGAVKEFMGYTPERFLAESSKVCESSGTELMVYRFDMSWNVKNSDEWSALLAKAKYVQFVVAKVKPGHMLDAEKQMGVLRDAILAKSPTAAGVITQLVTGGDPGTFVVRMPLQSVEDLAGVPGPRAVLGEDGYKQYSEMTAQNFSSFDYSLKELVPEWSNPPDSFVKANPDMWKPKPAATAKAKPAPDKKPAPAAGQ